MRLSLKVVLAVLVASPALAIERRLAGPASPGCSRPQSRRGSAEVRTTNRPDARLGKSLAMKKDEK